jgi:hypothetical protein
MPTRMRCEAQDGREARAEQEQGGYGGASTHGSKPWHPEDFAALDQVVERFPLGHFSWKKRLEEFGA